MTKQISMLDDFGGVLLAIKKAPSGALNIQVTKVPQLVILLTFTVGAPTFIRGGGMKVKHLAKRRVHRFGERNCR